MRTRIVEPADRHVSRQVANGPALNSVSPSKRSIEASIPEATSTVSTPLRIPTGRHRLAHSPATSSQCWRSCTTGATSARANLPSTLSIRSPTETRSRLLCSVTTSPPSFDSRHVSSFHAPISNVPAPAPDRNLIFSRGSDENLALGQHLDHRRRTREVELGEHIVEQAAPAGARAARAAACRPPPAWRLRQIAALPGWPGSEHLDAREPGGARPDGAQPSSCVAPSRADACSTRSRATHRASGLGVPVPGVIGPHCRPEHYRQPLPRPCDRPMRLHRASGPDARSGALARSTLRLRLQPVARPRPPASRGRSPARRDAGARCAGAASGRIRATVAAVRRARAGRPGRRVYRRRMPELSLTRSRSSGRNATTGTWSPRPRAGSGACRSRGPGACPAAGSRPRPGSPPPPS